MANDDLTASLLRALDAAPEDHALRLHVAEHLIAVGRPAEALPHCATVLATHPQHAAAQDLLRRATEALPAQRDSADFDWRAAETDVGPVAHPLAEPMFVTGAEQPEDEDPLSAFEVEQPAVRLDDVAGMAEVKRRLETAF